MRNLANKPVISQAHAQPKVLSYIYLRRLRQFSKMLSQSEKFNTKHSQALGAGLKDLKKDSWAAVPPAVWHYCSMKYYEQRTLSANEKLGRLVPKLVNEEKLSSFVEKQADTKKLGFFQKADRFMNSLIIGGLAWTGTVIVASFVLANLAYAAGIFMSGFSEPTAVAITIGMGVVSAVLGTVATIKINTARGMLSIGREKAQKLVSDVKKLAA